MIPTRLTLLLLVSCLAVSSCGASAGLSPALQQSNSNQSDAQPKVAKEAKPRAAIDPNKFAIIIAGVGGEEVYSKKFAEQAMHLYDEVTNRLGFDEKNVYLMTEAGSGGPENGSREIEGVKSSRATAEEARKAFASVKSAANADSVVLVVLIGHGSFDTQQAKFNLVGPDLTAKDYASLVGALPTRRVIFVNSASSSGEFVKPLSAQGRIVITATRSGNEQNATVFADNFIAALRDEAADADKNGRVSLLEAFNYATKLTADWYKQKNRLATEHALIDDNGDGTGHEEATAGDGTIAKAVYLDSKPMEQAGGDADLAKLLKERGRFEEEIEKLKARKAEMKQEDYDRELEGLLVELAKVNQTIKSRSKQ
ncbi:MAG TPA: hypothetical protein VJZ26_11930 [Blastocatellia bacterium]|nr:hypothetical protein [Blastocatellia bacterium]